MGYVGRIISTIIIWLVSFTWIIYLLVTAERIREGMAGMAAAIIIFAVYSLLSWQLGKQYDKVKYFSEKDDLTGAYNRRYFYQDAFAKLSKKTRKHKQTLCLFLFDIDDLKEVNDKHGHLDGDIVIQETASMLNRHTRKSDVVVRWGGDEFIVAAPDTNEAEAEVILNRIASEAASYSSEINRSLQLSAGYALYPKDGTNLDELIQKADQRMYARKRAAKASEQSE